MNIKQSSKNQKYRKIFKQKIKKYLKLLKKSLKLIFIKNTNRKYKNFMYQNNKKYKKSAKIINHSSKVPVVLSNSYPRLQSNEKYKQTRQTNAKYYENCQNYQLCQVQTFPVA